MITSIYSNVKVVSSNIKTNHKAIIACDSTVIVDYNKSRTSYQVRQRTPAQFAALTTQISQVNWDCVTNCSTPSLAFDNFYSIILTLLDKVFPLRAVTITSRDPYFVTPYIKCMLRKKNKLVRAGKQEEADALALKIQKLITEQNSTCFKDKGIENSGEMWKKVSEISGKVPNSCVKSVSHVLLLAL